MGADLRSYKKNVEEKYQTIIIDYTMCKENLGLHVELSKVYSEYSWSLGATSCFPERF